MKVAARANPVHYLSNWDSGISTVGSKLVDVILTKDIDGVGDCGCVSKRAGNTIVSERVRRKGLRTPRCSIAWT